MKELRTLLTGRHIALLVGVFFAAAATTLILLEGAELIRSLDAPDDTSSSQVQPVRTAEQRTTMNETALLESATSILGNVTPPYPNELDRQSVILPDRSISLHYTKLSDTSFCIATGGLHLVATSDMAGHELNADEMLKEGPCQE